MHANKLSTYNTKTTVIQQKVEVVKGKPMLKSVSVEKKMESPVAKCNSNKARAGNFDFAGLAG